MDRARLAGDHVKVDLLETVVLSLQHRPIEVVKVSVGPIVGVLDPEQGAYRGFHWMIVVPGNPDGLRTGGEVLIAKLRGNQDQEAGDGHHKVLETRLLELVVAVMLARVVGLVPGKAEAAGIR